MRAYRIAIVAGEPSGDLLGGELMAQLKALLPNAQFFGIGGKAMCQQGLRSIAPLEKLTVCGLVEVLKHLPSLLRIRARVKKIALSQRPDVYIGIDAPDFNLGLEKIFKRAGIPTVHYVAPSVWMWRKSRIAQIQRAVSHLLLILPFEQAIWNRAQVPATYVGHPLASRFPLVPRNTRSAPDTENKIAIALLPGSRASEMQTLGKILIDSAICLQQQYPHAVFLIPLLTQQAKDNWLALYKARAASFAMSIAIDSMQTVLHAADVVVVASGTATLEVALAKKPMVIIYRLNKLTHYFVKNKFYLPYFGLPNIIARRFIVPELIQEAATAENIAQIVSNYLNAPQLCQKLSAYLAHMHQTLHQSPAQSAAKAVLSVMGAAQHDATMRC